MRVDKDALIKHHFWIGLGLFFILILVDIVMIKTSAADVGGKAKADFDASKTNVTAAASKPARNRHFNEPWIEHGKAYRNQKEKVWSDAWDVQKDMFDWPSSSETQLSRLKYPDDEIRYPERMDYRDNLWKTQFQKLQSEVAPVEFRGGTAGFERIMLPGAGGGSAAAVQAAETPQEGAPSPVGLGILGRQRGGDGGGQPTVQPRAAGATTWDSFWRKVPTEEELWLAQEDYWVKRELLHIVKDAVRHIARFKEIKEDAKDGKKEPLPKDIVARHLFRNNLWEIDFLLEQKGRQWQISDRSTIKNLHPDHRTVPLSASPTSGGLHFAVRQSNKVYEFRVDGEPLTYGESSPFRKKWPVDSIDFKKPFELEQEFETANSPVRQIVDLQLWKHSHRTASMPLLTSLLIKPKADDLNTPPPAAAAAPGATKAPAAAAAATTPAAPAGGGLDADTTPNGLPRKRYLFRTEQVRHIPIALLLVVDQSQMHELLVAMSNSRLRVQTTQVEYRHLSGFRPETAIVGSAEQGGVVYTAEEDPNLLEVAIYGIASVYERFPPKGGATTPAAPPGTPAPAGTPAPPGTPAPGAPVAGTPGTPGKAGAAAPTGSAAVPATGTAAGKAGDGTKPAAGAPAVPPPAGKAAEAKTADAGKAPPAAKPADASKAPAPPAADAGKAPAPPPADKGKAPEPKKQ